MERPHHLGLHHVAIYVEDMAQARHFYVDLLGFNVEWEPDSDNLYLCSGSDNLALHRRSPADYAPRNQQRLDHMGIVVENAATVALWEKYLAGHQVEIVAATRSHRDGATSCYVRDPAGNVLQIIHHPPIATTLSTLVARTPLAK